MTLRRLSSTSHLCALLWVGMAPWLVSAAAAQALPAASVPEAPLADDPPRALPGPDQRNGNTMPALRPERAALPQVIIPLSRTARPPEPAPGLVRHSAAGASSADAADDVARCEAELGAVQRAACRSHLAREVKPR